VQTGRARTVIGAQEKSTAKKRASLPGTEGAREMVQLWETGVARTSRGMASMASDPERVLGLERAGGLGSGGCAGAGSGRGRAGVEDVGWRS
jgi:hypothetical protein